MTTFTRKPVGTTECPMCDAQEGWTTLSAGVVECDQCHALHGMCYLGDSYALVKPFMSDRTDMEGARYFDLSCVGSAGITRRHGWYDPKTLLVLQAG